MTVGQTVERLGGFARWRELRRHHPRRTIERATREGSVIRVAHNTYTVPSTVEGVRTALRLGAM